jgi:hypothetical protein
MNRRRFLKALGAAAVTVATAIELLQAPLPEQAERFNVTMSRPEPWKIAGYRDMTPSEPHRLGAIVSPIRMAGTITLGFFPADPQGTIEEYLRRQGIHAELDECELIQVDTEPRLAWTFRIGSPAPEYHARTA